MSNEVFIPGAPTEDTPNMDETKDPKFTYGEVIEGNITMVNLDRGFGFIESKARPYRRFFFHWTALRPETLTFELLTGGMKVRFTEATSKEKGPRAVHIEVLE